MDKMKQIGLVLFAVLLGALLLLSGCRTKYVEKPVEVLRTQHDTIWRTAHSVERDTLLVRDSIIVDSGKVQHVYHTTTSIKWRMLTDTLYVARTDTIEKPIYIKTTQTSNTTLRQKVLLGIAIFLAIASPFILFLVWLTKALNHYYKEG